MPAVAQISVDFARRSDIISSSTLPPTNVKSVNPLTLTGYLLYNRELPLNNNGVDTPSNLSYQGGFITAGDRINVKHNDLQLRQNLEVGKYVQTEFIFSRTKENNDSYLTVRQNNTRSVTISPRVEDININLPDNVNIKIGTEPNRNFIDLFTKRTSDESSIKINNTSSDISIVQRTDKFTLTAPTIQITGTSTHTGAVTVTGETTINNTVNIKDDLKIGTAAFNQFTVTGSTGAVAFEGNLNIKTDKFTVLSASGNTSIAGTLVVGNNTTIKGETTLEKKVTFNQGNVNSDNRRITGVRQLVDIAEFNTSVYDNDVLSVGDFKKFGFKRGMIMCWAPLSTDTYSANFNNVGLGIGVMTGWAVCNGETHSGVTTPNLVNKFVIGGRASDGQTTITGSATTTGGSKDAVVVSHVHSTSTTVEQDHTHPYSDYYQYGSVTYPQVGGFEKDPFEGGGIKSFTNVGATTPRTTDGAGAHSHTVTIVSEGVSGVNRNLPPYYSLIYIVKIT